MTGSKSRPRPGMSIKPNTTKNKVADVDEAALAEFASGGDAATRQSPAKGGGASRYPWQAPNVRPDVEVRSSIRLSEPYHLKLLWLDEQGFLQRENRTTSRHAFMLQAVTEAIDELIKKHTGK